MPVCGKTTKQQFSNIKQPQNIYLKIGRRNKFIDTLEAKNKLRQWVGIGNKATQ